MIRSHLAIRAGLNRYVEAQKVERAKAAQGSVALPVGSTGPQGADGTTDTPMAVISTQERQCGKTVAAEREAASTRPSKPEQGMVEVSVPSLMPGHRPRRSRSALETEIEQQALEALMAL